MDVEHLGPHLMIHARNLGMLDDAPAPAPPPASDPSAERVLVVPRAAFDDLGGVAGFTPAAPDHPILAGLLKLPATFRPRGEVETDESYLQLIPYVVLRHAGRVFAYDRGRAGGESRLHGRWSVGIGGHVNEEDAWSSTDRVGDVLEDGAWREIVEEMGYLPGDDDTFLATLGLIFDPSDAVGRVHLGIAYTLDLDRPPLVPIGSTRHAMVDPAWAADHHGWSLDRYESWSRLVLAHLAAAAAGPDGMPAGGGAP